MTGWDAAAWQREYEIRDEHGHPVVGHDGTVATEPRGERGEAGPIPFPDIVTASTTQEHA